MSIQAITMQPPVAPATTGAPHGAPPPASRAPAEATSGRPVPASSLAEQKQQLEAAVKAVAEFTRPMTGNLEFSVDEQTGTTVIKVTDATTKELIRQIPSEEMLEIARALDRLQGLLVRQKA